MDAPLPLRISLKDQGFYHLTETGELLQRATDGTFLRHDGAVLPITPLTQTEAADLQTTAESGEDSFVKILRANTVGQIHAAPGGDAARSAAAVAALHSVKTEQTDSSKKDVKDKKNKTDKTIQ